MPKKRERQHEGKEKAHEGETPEVNVDGLFKSFGLGALFNGMSALIEKAADLAEKGEELKKTGEFRIGGIPGRTGREGELRGVYGFSIRTLAGSKPSVQTFGNIRKTPVGLVVEEEREPIVDVFDEDDLIKVIAELPGIDEKDIRMEVRGDVLILSAEGEARKYHKEILLPAIVDEQSVSSKYEKGILEVGLRKKGS